MMHSTDSGLEAAYTIDLTDIKTRSELHDLLFRELRLPSYYGRNLDALRDVLSEGEPRSITFRNGSEAGEELQGYLSVLRRVCEDLAREVPGFSAVFLDRDASRTDNPDM